MTADTDAGADDPRIDALYDLPAGDFTAARNALVRALKKEDQRAVADRVAKLRRPAVAAWAVNQAVRHHRDRFAALLEAGAQVRREQRRALSGVRGSDMRDAARGRRRMIEEMTDLAVAALAEQGAGGDAHRGDITATFDAASADDDAAAQVGEARLAAPLPVTSGFGGMDGLTLLADAAAPTREEDAEEAGDAEVTEAPEAPAAAEEDADAAAERERAADARRAAMRAVEEARRLVADAESAVKRAEDAAVARGAAADQAERAAADAERVWRRRQQQAADLRKQEAAERERAERARETIAEHTAVLRVREQRLQDLDG